MSWKESPEAIIFESLCPPRLRRDVDHNGLMVRGLLGHGLTIRDHSRDVQANCLSRVDNRLFEGIALPDAAG